MATKLQLEKIAGKALLDREFRAELLKDPKAAAKSKGVNLKQEQVDRIMNINVDNWLQKWAAQLDAITGEGGRFLW